MTASIRPATAVDTDLTADENLADALGARIAFDAYKAAAAAQPVADTTIAPFTREQLFFVAFAQMWCGEPDAAIQRFLATFDPHVAPRARVNASLSGLPEFADAFHCPAGLPMRTEPACPLL